MDRDLLSSYLEKIAAASAVDIAILEQELFGRKNGVLSLALKELGNTTPEERKVKGAELNAIKQQLEQAIDKRKSQLDSAALGSIADSDRLDVTIDLPHKERGHLHPIPEFMKHIGDVFGSMGFDVASGPEMESEEFNFDFLNIGKDHPARDSHDTFWLKDMENMVMRTHTSPVQIRYMSSHKPPFRMVCPGKVYRKDADATHSPMFHQCEGMMIDRHVSLANMKAVITQALQTLIGKELTFRFRTSFFPFVEPGMEIDMLWKSMKDGKPQERWLEVGGCGMVHPNVLTHGGVDPAEFQGFAFGFGVERLLMIKHEIHDLRLFYEGDLRFLKQF